MSLIQVAAIKMSSAGATINSDNCIGAKTATGEYTLDLGTDMGTDEALFVVVPQNGDLRDYSLHREELQADGSTVIVRFQTLVGTPLDSAFSLIAYKFQAGGA